MSLLKWKELAKRKTELGNKINYVHNTIKQHKIGEETSQESFGKLFKPVTSKLDDVIDSNLNLRMPPQRRKRLPEIDYAPEVDPYEDMDVEGLIDFGDNVPPQQDEQPPQEEKQMGPIPTIHVDPPDDPPDDPPEYDYSEEVDYAINNEDQINERLNELDLSDYNFLKLGYDAEELTKEDKQQFFKHMIDKATTERNRLKGFKADVTRKFNDGKINEATKQLRNKKIDNDRDILADYINFNNDLIKKLNNEQKASGIRGRGRKQRGGNVMFFNDANQLLKKLELIIGEVLAGNTSIKMRNMGVNILDTLLKMATINRSQYNKIYNNYFKT